MHIPRSTLVPLLLAALLLPGCSMLTKSGRQQAAYARYVSKMSKGRVKQQRFFHSKKPAMPVTEPVETKEPTISSGPQAVAENAP
jgi:hypothetical protein